jgi:hypothetical protein
MKQDVRIPLKTEVKNRKELFAEVNEFVRSRNGWITSIPGAEEVTMECLPGSTLPADMCRRFGYILKPDGEGTRIIPHAITEDVITEARPGRPSGRRMRASSASTGSRSRCPNLAQRHPCRSRSGLRARSVPIVI